MMNRWTFLIFLVVILLIITSFVLFTTIDEDRFYDQKIPDAYKVIFWMLIIAFSLPILAFLMYLFYNGMFSFAMCR